MLAEGIMLYLLVVRVFGTIASRWYYLLILGWGKMSDLIYIECYTLNTSMHAWLIYSWTLVMNMYRAGYYHLSIFGHDNYYKEMSIFSTGLNSRFIRLPVIMHDSPIAFTRKKFFICSHCVS
jgi:hypothetical protein